MSARASPACVGTLFFAPAVLLLLLLNFLEAPPPDADAGIGTGTGILQPPPLANSTPPGASGAGAVREELWGQGAQGPEQGALPGPAQGGGGGSAGAPSDGVFPQSEAITAGGHPSADIIHSPMPPLHAALPPLEASSPPSLPPASTGRAPALAGGSEGGDPEPPAQAPKDSSAMKAPSPAEHLQGSLGGQTLASRGLAPAAGSGGGGPGVHQGSQGTLGPSRSESGGPRRRDGGESPPKTGGALLIPAPRGHTRESPAVKKPGAAATSSQPGVPARQAAGALAKEKPPDTDTLVATKFLKESIAFPGAQQCGAWSAAYPAMHKQMQSGQHPAPRFLVFRGEQGLGDRLLGLVSAFLIALLTSRALLIEDEVLPLAFEPALVDWRRGPTYSTVAAGTREYSFRNPRGHVNLRKLKGPLARARVAFLFQNWGMDGKGRSVMRLPKDLKGYFERLNAAPILTVDTNAGVLTQILRRDDSISPSTARALRGMGMRLDNGVACVLRLLLRPRPGAWQPIVPTVVRMGVHRGRPALCLQERAGDRDSFNLKTGQGKGGLPKRQKGSVHALMRCGERVMSALPSRLRPRTNVSVSRFFITENQQLRKYVHRQYKDVVQSPVVPQHVAFTKVGKQRAALEAVQDWLLFSLCQYYVLANSGFSKTAAAYSLARKAIFTHPRFGWAFGKCDGRNPDTLEALGATWSGL